MEKTQLFEFEPACAFMGVDPVAILSGTQQMPEWLRKPTEAFAKLTVMQQAINKHDGFTPDFSDDDQYKYTAWGEWSPSVGGFVYACPDYTRTDTNLGARFWFEDRETAREFFERNAQLHNDLLLPVLQ